MEGNICDTALWLGQYHDISLWYSTVPALVVKPRHHTCTCYNCWIQTTPTSAVWIMHSCGNRIQPSGFALVLYEVTALVHYTPYSTGWGALTIT